MRWRGLGFCLALLIAACGPPPVTVVPASTPTPAATAPPSATPAPSPTASAAPSARTTFNATVIPAEGANIRSWPGMDRPVVGLARKGAVLVFDGWYRHADDPPQPDAETGRVEAWSRDWYHLADGRGWVHSSTLDGLPPAGMPQMDPDSFPILITGR